MKNIRTYENYFNKNEIINFCNKYLIKNYEVDSNGIINVNGEVNIGNTIISHKISEKFKKKNMKTIPFKFGKVDGDFDCSGLGLTTLKNCPDYTNAFFCDRNELETLLGGPNNVYYEYVCPFNNLKDVYGFPEFFNGKIHIMENPVEEIINLVDNALEIRFIRLLNEYKVIRNGSDVIQNRLIDAFSDIGYNKFGKNGEKLADNEFKNYRII